MARNLFGGSSDDYAVDSTGRPIAVRRVRFYTSAAMTTEITDLASDAAGTGAPLTVNTDAHGFWGPVYGPDGVTTMYAGTVDSGGNPPAYVVAIYTHTSGGVASFNTRAGAVSLTKADVTATALAAADVGAPNVVVHGSTAGTARPAGATVVHWIGSIAPTNVTGNDEWTDTTNKLLKRWNGSAFDALGSAAYVASSAGATGNAAAPHAQLGPTAYTLNSGAVGTMHSVLALRGNDPSGDGTLRLYITPNMAGSTGIAGYTYGETAGIKIFGDPYFDGAGYRDFGIVYAPAWKENTPYDTGSWGTGAYWLNSKIGPDAGTAGALWSNNPDIGFSFQDGTFIAGRFSYVKNLAQNASWPGFIVGAGKQDIIRRTSAIVMEVQGDIGFNSTSRSIRWYQPDATTADNTVTFNSNDVTFTFSSVRRWQVKGNGSLIMGDGSTALGTTAQSGYFYMRSMAGTPTGAPGDGVSGATPLVMDTTAGKLWANLGGTWKSVTFA